MTRKLISAACAALLCCSVPSAAQEWSDNAVGYRGGAGQRASTPMLRADIHF